MKTGGDILEAASLIKILFGGEKQYEYKLRLAQKLDLPLFRERNFLYPWNHSVWRSSCAICREMWSETQTKYP